MKSIFLVGVFSAVLVGCATVSETSLESTPPHITTVDYGRSVEDLLLAGAFTWAHPEITSGRFPGTETGPREIVIVLTELPRHLTLEKIIEHQRQRLLRPATLKELLSFAHQHPEAQLVRTIVCLGSSCSLYAKERSASADRTFGLQTTQRLPRSDQIRLQTFWPYLDCQGSMRIINLGQLSFMRQDQGQTLWGCFVAAD